MALQWLQIYREKIRSKYEIEAVTKQINISMSVCKQ